MPRPASAIRPGLALVLAGVVGTSAASIAAVIGLEAHRASTTTPALISAAPLARLVPLAPETAEGPGGRESLALGSSDESVLPSRVPRDGVAGARGERELREAWARRQRAEPGWLEREAASILASDRPAPEKVALLRALEDVGSPELARWLERAVLTVPDVARPEGESVPAFALGRLQLCAARDPEARLALLRLAFEAQSLSLPNRRRAAAAAAASCAGSELVTLENGLLRERDAELLRGAVAALRGRRTDGHVQRMLDLFGVTAAERSEPVADPGVE